MFEELKPEIAGVIMAIVTAILRIIYDKTERKPVRIALEAALCGALTLAAHYALAAMGVDSNWSIATGGFIGYLGPASVRAMIVKVFKSKIK